MYRFEIDGNNLVVTNTANNEVQVDYPHGAVSIKIEDGRVFVIDIFHELPSDLGLIAPLDQCQDPDGTTFSEASLRTWARANVGFDPAGSAASSTDSTFIAKGVLVDTAPPWEGSLVLGNEIEGNISTGMDLTQVDEINVSFVRVNTATGIEQWRAPTATIRIEDIVLDVLQGAMMIHFDNQYLSIANTSQAMLEAGNIRFRAETGSNARSFKVDRIEFKKRVDLVTAS